MRDAGDGHRVAGGRAAAVLGALDDDDRLDGGRAAGQPGELAGVADGLQVQQDHVRGGVLVPVLEDVVAGDVGPVARRDERRHARTAPVQPRQQGDADGAGLGEQADAPGGRQLRGEGGVEPYALRGVDHAEGVGADDAHPVRAGLPHQGTLALPPLGAALRVPGRQDDEAAHAVLAAVRDGVRDVLGGHGDDGQVDGLAAASRPTRTGGTGGAGGAGGADVVGGATGTVGAVGGGTAGRGGLGADLPDRPVRGYAVQGGRALREGPVHGVDPAGEPGADEVAQDRAADPARSAARADDGDGGRGQEPLHGPRLGALLAGALHRQGAVGGLQVEVEADRAVLEAALLGVPGVREHLDHLGVGGQHLRREPPDAALPGDGGDVLQQRGGDPAALVGVLDEERDLRLVGGRARGAPRRVDPVVADGRDELASDGGGEPHPVHVVVVGEMAHVLGGEPGIGSEEPVVLRLVRHLLVEADQTAGVVRRDRSDPRGAAVAQHHVGFPVVGVGVRRVLGRVQHGPRVRGRSGTAPDMRDWSRQPLAPEGQHHG
ncbi:hypothetical protein BG846_00191 [Streptomyces fradiae ATCC 10745 = DSM 40063]|uniref:Uncharacterized protein n=1 Tax=Streptomyces fradiae ATCC 10745 = DSM 40063 TaxID=1319510 RepID=A0A1Y2P2W7_STRFR|nr:hypothetical protein BG846_00191 [Streptomyces fradiae ATCC 10745 = DSM 40063]